jgi:sugar phosphate isomerase/epimerase
MEEKDYTISNIYQGGYSSLSPSYGIFTGYRAPSKGLGLATDPRTANILKDASTKLSTGAKTIEISTVSPAVLESVPEPHLKEVNRLSKLTGVDITVHGPLVEPSGMTQQGFTESNREAAERQMSLAVERSHEMNPKGNFPVTFHSSVLLPGQVPPKGNEHPEEVYIINTETGEVGKIPLKKREFPIEKEEPLTPEREIQKVNKNSWGEKISQVAYYENIGMNALRRSGVIAETTEAEEKAGKKLWDEEKYSKREVQDAAAFIDNSYRSLKDMFEIAMKKGSEIDQDKLREFRREIEPTVAHIQANEGDWRNAQLKGEIVEKGIEVMRTLSAPPKVYETLNDFTKDKTATTFANIAYNSWREFKDKAPIISVENPPIGGAFATGKELKSLIEDSRKKFVERAVKTGMSEKEARNQAEKLLGVTWDVGHINMLRKYGYEDKDIVKEAEKVAPLVKHIHLSDNFGFEHTELPMGMGNVPLKETMEKLGKKADEAKKIVEAGNWYEHFQTTPFQETLEAFGSPLYSMDMAPYWNQTEGFQQGYFSGSGQMLPPVNYEVFGAGFSQLPQELGGQMGGAGGRMSGRPME